MSTPRRRTLATAATSLLTAAALLAGAGSAGAQPATSAGGGQIPSGSPKPVARFTVSPDPAVAGQELTMSALARRVRTAGQDVATQAHGDVVVFDASASTDDNGHIARYEWDLDGNGTIDRTTTTPRTSRSYTTTGLIAVHLRVTDDRGAASPVVTRTLRLHHAPKAAIWVSSSDAQVGETVTVSGGGSTDDNGIATLRWDLDDDGAFDDAGGSTVSAVAKPHFTTAGPHVIRLRVTDIYGATSIASTTIEVHAVQAR